MKWSILKYALFFNLVLLAACAAEPADGPGLCKLRCSDAIIAASDYKIESMTPDLSLKCIGTTDGTIQTARFTAKFRITRQRQSGSAVEEVGVPNVSITPTLYGLFDRSVDNEVQQGIYTDTSEFCSDQCGVVSLDFGVECPQQGDGEANLFIQSGGLFAKDESMRITIESASFERDDDGNTE